MMGRGGSVATHDLETGADYSESRSSIELMSNLVPSARIKDWPGRSFFYNPLHEQPLMLTVVKLDGTSFGIEVKSTRTVADLKRAVEATFSHLPKGGPGSISWRHVWEKFCLCHEGQKLLHDNDYIGKIGIKDGDKLQFVHHASSAVKVQYAGEDPDSDEEPNVLDGGKQEEEGSPEKEDDELETEDGVMAHCDCSLNHLVRRWFQYNKLNSSDKGERRCGKFQELQI